jgi:hypothetical protein
MTFHENANALRKAFPKIVRQTNPGYTYRTYAVEGGVGLFMRATHAKTNQQYL